MTGNGLKMNGAHYMVTSVPINTIVASSIFERAIETGH